MFTLCGLFSICPGRNFVFRRWHTYFFPDFFQSLLECYQYLKKRGGTIHVEVADSWLREYQVNLSILTPLFSCQLCLCSDSRWTNTSIHSYVWCKWLFAQWDDCRILTKFRVVIQNKTNICLSTWIRSSSVSLCSNSYINLILLNYHQKRKGVHK